MTPDVLLVDEALAVGDYYFRQRCLRRVHELRRRGVTILFVSHSMADVQALGTRALWLDQGRVADHGDPSAVARRYLARMNERDRAGQAAADGEPPPANPADDSAPVQGVPNADRRFGTGRAEVSGITVLDAAGRPARALVPGQTATVRISARARDHVASPNIGFMMRNHLGIDFAGTNTAREGHILDPMQPGETRTVDFHVRFPRAVRRVVLVRAGHRGRRPPRIRNLRLDRQRLGYTDGRGAWRGVRIHAPALQRRGQGPAGGPSDGPGGRGMSRPRTWAAFIATAAFLLLGAPALLVALAVLLACADLAAILPRRAKRSAAREVSKEGVSVVIPTWNGREHLARNLPSVLAALEGNPESEVLVIENGSDDGTAEFLAESFPSVRVVELGSNIGFGRASNHGFTLSRHDIVVLLNNDMRVEPDFLEPLLDGFRGSSGVLRDCPDPLP